MDIDKHGMIKHKELVKAWLDGAEIEYRSSGEEKWTYLPEPEWIGKFEYRIKPEIVKKWIWAYSLHSSPNSPKISVAHFSEETVNSKFGTWTNKIKLPWTEIEVEITAS